MSLCLVNKIWLTLDLNLSSLCSPIPPQRLWRVFALWPHDFALLISPLLGTVKYMFLLFHTDTKNCELRHHAAFLRRELDCTWIMCTYVVHIIWDKPGVGVEFFSLFFVQWSFCLATYLLFDVSTLSRHRVFDTSFYGWGPIEILKSIQPCP